MWLSHTKVKQVADWKKIPWNVSLNVHCSIVCFGFAVEIFREKKKKIQINQSVCVRACDVCYSSTCGFNLCSLFRPTPPLPFTETCDHRRRLCGSKQVISYWNLHQICPHFFFSFIMTRNTSQQKIQFCAAVVHTNRYSTTVVVCWLMSQ